MRLKTLLVLAALTAPAVAPVQAAPVPGAAPVRFPPARSVSVDLASEAVRAAQASCAPSPVGVAFIDAAGLPKLYYVPDGISGLHAVMGFRKANTALLLRAPSAELRARTGADAALAAKVGAAPDSYSPNAGGLPIFVNGELVGAIGISGAEPSEKAQSCAVDALRAIQGRLN
jgi:glc operon protein GlcG